MIGQNSDVRKTLSLTHGNYSYWLEKQLGDDGQQTEKALERHVRNNTSSSPSQVEVF